MSAEENCSVKDVADFRGRFNRIPEMSITRCQHSITRLEDINLIFSLMASDEVTSQKTRFCSTLSPVSGVNDIR